METKKGMRPGKTDGDGSECCSNIERKLELVESSSIHVRVRKLWEEEMTIFKGLPLSECNGR